MNGLAPITMKDAGVAAGVFHMYADAETLNVLQQTPVDKLVVRTFQWDKPTVTYGYLLDPRKVEQWAESIVHGPLTIDLVKRPTGGGAVLHSTTDLSFSLAWRREQAFFSETPRLCYAEIHARILKELEGHIGTNFSLFAKETGACEGASAKGPLPVCFKEPVCNDVMRDGQKIVGGALRITKNAVLYQGTIQLPLVAADDLKAAVRRAFA
jgi:lipoate-protein ligase A